MFVLKLETSLISIGTLANRGLVMFGKKYVKLGMRGRNLRLSIRRGQNMFEMQCDVFAWSFIGAAQYFVGECYELLVFRGSCGCKTKGSSNMGECWKVMFATSLLRQCICLTSYITLVLLDVTIIWCYRVMYSYRCKLVGMRLANDRTCPAFSNRLWAQIRWESFCWALMR